MVSSPYASATCALAPRAPALRRRSDAMAELDPLIRRAQRAEPQALRELFLRYRGDVTRVAFRVLGPSADLEDVVQESFVQVYRSLGSYQGTAKFSTWLYRVVTNVARMHLRRERSRPQLDGSARDVVDAQVSPAGRPDADAERGERVRALYRHLEQLSERKRTVLILHDLEGLP